jgi:hypothetical protein
VLTRSPCSLGPDWVRCKNTDGHAEERGKTQHQKTEATSPYERAKKRHERAEATRVEKTKTATKAEATGDEKNAGIDDGATTTKKKKMNRKKAAASTSRTAAKDPASTTDLPLGSRVPCLGCGEVLTMLPSRHAPEHCDLCMDWYGRICDAFQKLENGEDDRLKTSDDEKELEELWAERGGDPHFLQETREQWNAATPSLSTTETSASTSSSANTTSTTSTDTSNTSSTATSSKKKKKRKKQRAKQVVITIQENDEEEDDDDDEEIDPRQLGWEECARRGRLESTTTNSGLRGRPTTRPKQL